MIDINSTLIVGKYKQEYKLSDFYPIIPKDQKMTVFVSGGMESTLIAKICQILYGKDRTVLLYTDNLFVNGPNSKKIVANNAKNVERILHQPVYYIPTDKTAHTLDARTNVKNIKKYIKENYNSDQGMIGFTDLFWKLEVLKQPGMNSSRIKEELLNNKLLYKDVIEEIHLFTDSYEEHINSIDINTTTWELLNNSDTYGLLSPVKTLNKHAIVDIYRQLGWQDLLARTRSCVDVDQEQTNAHCGKCFNCQQRHDGFDMLDLEDPTVYQSNLVVQKRNRLKENIKLYEL